MADDKDKPKDEARKSVDEKRTSVDQGKKSIDEKKASVDQGKKSVDETKKSVDESTRKSVDEGTRKSIDQGRKSVDQSTRKSVDESTRKSIDQAKQPEDERKKSVDQGKKSIDETKQSGQDQGEKPVDEGKRKSIDQKEPVEKKKKSIDEHKPKPQEDTEGEESSGPASDDPGAQSGSTQGFDVQSDGVPTTATTAPHNSDETDHSQTADEGGEVALYEPEGQEEEEDEMDFLKQMAPQSDLTTEEQEAEEAEFRSKYALDLEEEGEGETQTEYEELAGEEGGAMQPSPEQMDAIIKFLEEEEAGEDDDEEEEEGDESEGPPPQRYSGPLNLHVTPVMQEPEQQDSGLIETKDSGLFGKRSDKNPKDAEGEPSIMVLGPDHPKMQRFQRALKEHLEKQVYAADCEMRNLENDLKSKRKERTEFGTTLYNLQHEMLRQSECMEKYEKALNKFQEKRQKTEAKTVELRTGLLSLKTECQKEEEKELSLRESIKTLDFTEHIVREAAEKYEGELKTRQLIDEKLSKMKAKTEAEKRDQDFYLDKVLTHVQHMEVINAGIRRQIQAHQEEQKELSTYINEAVTEIEALQIEKLHLQRAWNETITVVRSRDDALVAARVALQKTKEELRIRESELKSIARLITKEQEGHEKSVILLRRRRMEERILKNQLLNLQQRNEGLKDQLADLNKVKQQVDLDLLRANNSYLRKEKEVSGPRKLIEQLAIEKIKLEDQILAVLHERSGLNKAASHIQVLIKEARQKTRHMENEVSRVENENSLLAVDVEALRAELFKKTSMLSELDKRCSAQEKILQEQMKDIQQSERLIQKKTGEVEKLNKKLEKIVTQQGGVEMGPMEREIEDLEKQISVEKDQVNRLQEEWLRRQDDLVRLTTQRDSVIHQNELLRKEVFIMERKRQRLDMEVEKKKCEINRVQKSTETIRAEITTVNAKLHQDRSNHDQMDKDNILIQNELMALLKDAEMEAVELEHDIEVLEVEKQNLLQLLHEAHEQNLQWEKKVHLAKELKDNLKKDQENSTSALRLDIHHMQVRYNEIVRTQEKLMSDLERSVDRRDRIIQQADLTLQRDNVNPKNTKLNIQRNFNSLKERNRLLVREAVEIEQTVRDTMDSIRELEDKLNEASNNLNKVREAIQAFETKIADASIQKHKNLVEIVLRQEKFRILESMKYNRYKPTAKSIDDIQRSLDDTERDCYALVELSEKIATEHPEASVHVKLVKASILPSNI